MTRSPLSASVSSRASGRGSRAQRRLRRRDLAQRALDEALGLDLAFEMLGGEVAAVPA